MRRATIVGVVILGVVVGLCVVWPEYAGWVVTAVLGGSAVYGIHEDNRRRRAEAIADAGRQAVDGRTTEELERIEEAATEEAGLADEVNRGAR